MASEQLQSILQLLRARASQRPANASIEEMRAGYEAIGAMFPVAADVRCEPTSAGGARAPSGSCRPGRDCGACSCICTAGAM